MHYVMNVKALLKSERMNKMNCKVEKTKNANDVPMKHNSHTVNIRIMV